MERLTTRERELVALGAALGSNCVPCIEYHIPAAKQAGLTNAQISEAIKLAVAVKKVPADKVLATVMALVEDKPEEDCKDPSCACHQKAEEADTSPCCS